MEDQEMEVETRDFRIMPRADGDVDGGFAALHSATDEYVRLKRELTEERTINADLVKRLDGRADGPAGGIKQCGLLPRPASDITLVVRE